MAGGGFKFLLKRFLYLITLEFINFVFSMNLWRKAPWRGTFQCEAPFRLVQFCGEAVPLGKVISAAAPEGMPSALTAIR
jgi:hypothetical protein